jgi:hypothetical protein
LDLDLNIGVFGPKGFDALPKMTAGRVVRSNGFDVEVGVGIPTPASIDAGVGDARVRGA